MKSYVERLCKFCKLAMMKIDDIDYNFDGNQDEYLYCPNCNATLFVKVRYKKCIFHDWSKPDY